MNEPDAPYASETEAVEDSEEKETVLSMIFKLKAVLTVIKLIVHNADMSAETKVELIMDELRNI